MYIYLLHQYLHVLPDLQLLAGSHFRAFYTPGL